MNRFLLLLFSLLLLVLFSCGEKSPADHSSSDGLRCSIILSKTQLAQGDKAVVSVRVENVSGGPVALTVLPAFVLADSIPRYVALSDITGKDADFGHNSRLALSLAKGAAVTSDIDISALLWTLMVSSIPPDKHLYEEVKPGEYTLRLDIEVTGGDSPAWIRSNEVSITIEP